ncbi:MAG: phenylalanine--tRNA ligase subunit alpha [Oscillospiraceae bacterium]|nr:phenylalanine--tRNA ligase subunit alpha [Oscillospiraceae bacterium]
MKLLLQEIHDKAKNEVKDVFELKNLKDLRVKYLGKKGEITQILKNLNTVGSDERPEIGKIANIVRSDLESLIAQKEKELEDKILTERLESERIDVTIKNKRVKPANLHPLTIVTRELEDIFLGMGFEIASGPEIETVYNNFDALNTPLNHPSRDLEDTFYINNNIVLRTQTSSVQIRTMRDKKPPIKVISPGRVYRSDDVDATHSPVFHQLEGLVVDKDISMSDLKWTLETFIKKLYGQDIKIRFRPHYFPFTEPSAEIDISCFVCGGKGCRVCKGEGFIEILGAGLVHPNVLKNCGIDPEIYSGFAFGMGLDRIVMRRFNIDDLRLLYDNDIRFLSQF